ncbi:MAG: tetraacyldisaccharide 4'-kinase [Gallionella sp.]|nr:tetraacyldisaccharide 4'-kinase [Gallionella sp.]MDD4958865.1 tetraacyldisaccharide 4'-kinase [Gallionella sp.]
MHLPDFWHRRHPLHLLLLPIGWLFGALAGVRRVLYRTGIFKSVRLAVPVIIVGNISVGGTGKTPLTLALARQLVEHGYHPLIVSRGYGGNAQQPQRVAHDSTAAQVGDEPSLMARRGVCPVWIGRDRAAAAQLALVQHPECNVILCDDGLQHYRLRRDVEIVVVDGVRGFGNGWLLPAGMLREPIRRLQTVDAVVVNGGSGALDINGRIHSPQFAMQLSGAQFVNLLHPQQTAQAADFQGLRLHAVAGIGNPQRYFDHLTSLGLSFTPHAFPDHHPYAETDLAFEACDALLLTEKDAVKCASFADAKFWVLRVDAQLDPALIELLRRKLPSHGCKTA